MKLFITNKPDLDLNKESAIIHKLAFAEMSTSIAEGFIPLEIFISYYSQDFLFEFVNKKNELFFYKFTQI